MSWFPGVACALNTPTVLQKPLSLRSVLAKILEHQPLKPTRNIKATPLAAEAPPEPWAWQLGVLVGYLLLGLGFTWPLVLHMGDGAIQIGTMPVDAGQGIWNLWWTYTSLVRGENPFVTGHLFYPLNLILFYQTLSLPNALSVWPVLALAGPVVAFNTLIILGFGLGGFWAYRLGRALGAHRQGALLAGFVFAFTPYHLQRVWGGTLELAATHWLALYALLLLRALSRRTLGSVAVAGLTLFVTTLASQYHGLYAAVYTAAHGGLAVLLAPRGQRGATLVAGAGVGIIWAALLLPVILLAGGIGNVALEDWYARQVYHAVALVDLVMPNNRHPLWGATVAAWQQTQHPFGMETGAGMGLGVTFLCGFALWRRWAAAWPWALLAGLCLLLAMGPQLQLTAATALMPGPFLALDLLTVFRNSSRPTVFVALLLVPVVALVALGLDALTHWGNLPELGAQQPDRAQQGQKRWAISAWLLIALILGENLVTPWPIMPLRAAAESVQLNTDPVPGAVLELPPRLNDSRSLLNQLCHGRPLMGGYLARLPPYALTNFPSVTRALWHGATSSPDIIPLHAAAELASLGVRFVALDLTELPRGEQAALRAWLSGPGISQFSASATRTIYAVEPTAAAPVSVLGAGWYNLEQAGARRWRWMGERAEVTLLAREPAAVALSLQATAYGQPRPLELWQNDVRLAHLEVPAAPYDRAITLRLLLPPGATTLTLASPAEISPDGRRLSLSVGVISLTQLNVAAAWAAEGRLAIPPTRPALGLGLCGP